MSEFKGFVKAMRKDRTAVCIILDKGTDQEREAWFDFGEKIKPEYIKSGAECEFDAIQQEEGNAILTFIKCNSIGAYNSQKSPYKKEFKPASMPLEDNTEMKRMSALKNAALIYSGTGKEKEFEKLTDKILGFIEKGIWINDAGKYVQEGKVSPEI